MNSRTSRRKRNFRIAERKITKEDEAEELKRIEFRYERILPKIPNMLQNIRNQKTEIIDKLKEEMFLDWHILQGIENLLINFYNKDLINEIVKNGMNEEYVEQLEKNAKKLDEYDRKFVNYNYVTYIKLRESIIHSLNTDAIRHGFEPKRHMHFKQQDLLDLIKTRCPFLFILDINHPKDIWGLESKE